MKIHQQEHISYKGRFYIHKWNIISTTLFCKSHFSLNYFNSLHLVLVFLQKSAMASATLFCLVLSAFFFLISEAANTRFHVNLIHRDSPSSPLFNPSESHSQRLNNAFQRSISRIDHHFKPSLSNSAQAKIISNHGEYLMEIFIGTPPFKILGIADTGSDLIWTQCKPCAQCYTQTNPLFDPRASSTFREVPCNNSLCQSLGKTICNAEEICHYSAFYGDKSFTHGILGFETVTLNATSGRPAYFPHTAFGCGFNNNGTFDKEGSGIIGLGRGEASFITRIYSSIGGKFSHCLVPISSSPEQTSKMSFGRKAVVSGTGAVSTPLHHRKDASLFYFVTLKAISVGHKRLKYRSNRHSNSTKSSARNGNIIIDSGTTLTMLPEKFYAKVESEVIKAIKGVERVHHPELLPLCYNTTKGHFRAPVITMHFRRADLELDESNSFVRVSEDVICFAFGYTPDFPYSVLGNLAQANFLVGYDLEKKTVTFKKADCTKY